MPTTEIPIQELKLPQLKVIAEMYGITKTELVGNASRKQTWIDAITVAARKEEAIAAQREETAPPSDTLFDLSAYTKPISYTNWADAIDVEGDDDELLPLRSPSRQVPALEPEVPALEPEVPALEPEVPTPGSSIEDLDDEDCTWELDTFLPADVAAARFSVGEKVWVGKFYRPDRAGTIVKFATCNRHPNMPLVLCDDGIERFLPPQLMEAPPYGQLSLIELDEFDIAIAEMEAEMDECGRTDRDRVCEPEYTEPEPEYTKPEPEYTKSEDCDRVCESDCTELENYDRNCECNEIVTKNEFFALFTELEDCDRQFPLPTTHYPIRDRAQVVILPKFIVKAILKGLDPPVSVMRSSNCDRQFPTTHPPRSPPGGVPTVSL